MRNTPPRALARFLDDLVPTTRIAARIVPIVFQCERCPKYHHVAVRFLADDDEPTVHKLPDNCDCGEPLDTPWIIRDCIGTARLLIETAHATRHLQ